MKRSLFAIALFSTAALLMLGAPPGEAMQEGKKDKKKANDGIVSNWGKPTKFEGPNTKVNGYWLWYDDGVWYLRTTGGGKGSPHFQGTIEVAGGKFVGLQGKKGETVGKNADKFITNKDLTAIAFDFTTDEGVDGVNFAVAPGTATLKFTLAMNKDAAPKHIFVGKDGDHPPEAVFVAPGHPADPPTPKKKDKK